MGRTCDAASKHVQEEIVSRDINRSFGSALMRMRRKMNLIAGAFCLAGAMIAANANASIIYFDDFSGSNDAGLNGTAPDTRPGSETWTSSDPWKADGSKSGGGNATAYLPFTPESGKTYTLSVDVNTTNTGGDWLAVGFTQNADTSQVFHSTANTAYAWVLRKPGNALESYLGAGTNGNGNFTATAGVVSLKIVLDTTTPLWSVEWHTNDTLRRTASFTANPTINYVSFGAFNSGTGTVDNFTLSVVPEPAALGLLAIGGLMMLRRQLR